MASGWMQDTSDKWNVAMLTGDAWSLGDSESWLRPASEGRRADVLLLRVEAGRIERWLLLASRAGRVTVNGVPLELGLCELRDRDEVLVAGQNGGSADGAPRRFFFSSERLARVEPMPAGTRPVYCVRCKQLIEVGALAVRCPSQACGLWHHQSSELPCWEYAECCATCDQPTELNVGFRWTPADL